MTASARLVHNNLGNLSVNTCHSKREFCNVVMMRVCMTTVNMLKPDAKQHLAARRVQRTGSDLATPALCIEILIYGSLVSKQDSLGLHACPQKSTCVLGSHGLSLTQPL